jgi:nicotinamidase-related amidase
LIPELKLFENNFCVIKKNTTNGFNTKQFKNLVEKYTFDQIFVTGCCTDICVETFVNSLLKFNSENKSKTNVYVVSNAVATFNSENHNADVEQINAIERMKNNGAKFLSDTASCPIDID